MKKADQKKLFKEELTEWIDEHTPVPDSTSEEGWVSEDTLTPGPHFPKHMHKEVLHERSHHGRSKHFRNDPEVSDRLRFNINYMEVPPAYNGVPNHRNDIFDLPNLIEEDNDVEENLFDTQYGHPHYPGPYPHSDYPLHYNPHGDYHFSDEYG